MRKVKFVNNEYYHIFNRGVDKRVIFPSPYDLDRFLQSMEEFNVLEPIGSLYVNRRRNKKCSNPVTTDVKQKLVNFICYCLNPNHYHFILEPLVDEGIEKLMQKIGTGFTRHFNEKYERTGVLFQGPFKAVHIDSNRQLLHDSVYVNLNNCVHKISNGVTTQFKSSWDEYITDADKKGSKGIFCEKDIILGQFKSVADYKKFAEESLEGILEKRYKDGDI